MITTIQPSDRLYGLDLARFFAFLGMVIVNFKIVMGVSDDDSTLYNLAGVLEGKAAAIFVVLAGIGLGLSVSRNQRNSVGIIVKRAGFLLVLGLVNSIIFDADILHYYAFYFLFAALFFSFNIPWLVISIVVLNLAFLLMIFVFDYNTGWNWDDYTYVDFWTPIGFFRNLFFNGWHPVIPWMGFVLFGMILSKLSLTNVITQNRIILSGAISYLFILVISEIVAISLAGINPELSVLATTEPIPPVPLYILAGFSSACVVIGLCLKYSHALQRIGLLKVLIPAGKQTLSLYIAHIVFGMGILEAFGLLGGQTINTAVVSALLFCFFSVIFAYYWSKSFKRGPIETIMRKIAG